jgi:hypothetical protein
MAALAIAAMKSFMLGSPLCVGSGTGRQRRDPEMVASDCLAANEAPPKTGPCAYIPERGRAVFINSSPREGPNEMLGTSAPKICIAPSGTTHPMWDAARAAFGFARDRMRADWAEGLDRLDRPHEGLAHASVIPASGSSNATRRGSCGQRRKCGMLRCATPLRVTALLSVAFWRRRDEGRSG